MNLLKVPFSLNAHIRPQELPASGMRSDNHTVRSMRGCSIRPDDHSDRVTQNCNGRNVAQQDGTLTAHESPFFLRRADDLPQRLAMTRGTNTPIGGGRMAASQRIANVGVGPPVGARRIDYATSPARLGQAPFDALTGGLNWALSSHAILGVAPQQSLGLPSFSPHRSSAKTTIEAVANSGCTEMDYPWRISKNGRIVNLNILRSVHALPNTLIHPASERHRVSD